jgi:hypothetical protein
VTVAALIKTFSTWEDYPIDVDKHVLPEFLKLGVKDDIWFWPDPKLNPSIMRGNIEYWECPLSVAGPVRYVADITYAAQLDHEWQRLVCCKELLHILDPASTRASKDGEIETLIEKIILPADLQDPFTDGIHAITDRVAITYAAAILFPLAQRELFLPAFNEGKISLPKIADLLEIPVRYAALVMNDVWPSIHGILVETQ